MIRGDRRRGEHQRHPVPDSANVEDGRLVRFPTDRQPLLIAEPAGGDLQVEAQGIRRVSQFKTKANEGPWSLTTVIDEVLPDLFRAVEVPLRPTTYSFVTDGRLGTWGSALEFFNDLRTRNPTPGHELDALDNSEKFKFSSNYTATEQELFLRVVTSVRSGSAASDKNLAVTVTKVWHLLENFQLETGQSKDDADAEITRLLRQLGVAPDDVKVKRATLVGVLTQFSAKGNAPFTPEVLLREAQLVGIPLSQFERNAKASYRLFIDDIERAGYTSGTRIKRKFELPADCKRWCFAGDSGSGKSWAMAAVADEATG